MSTRKAAFSVSSKSRAGDSRGAVASGSIPPLEAELKPASPNLNSQLHFKDSLISDRKFHVSGILSLLSDSIRLQRSAVSLLAPELQSFLLILPC